MNNDDRQRSDYSQEMDRMADRPTPRNPTPPPREGEWQEPPPAAAEREQSDLRDIHGMNYAYQPAEHADSFRDAEGSGTADSSPN